MIEITLTKGYTTIIDDIDADLAEYNWYTHIGGGGNVYARRDRKIGGKRTHIYLHREILKRKLGHSIPVQIETDHISRDSLDNRRSNLRPATHSQNIANSKRITEVEGCKIDAPYRGVQRARQKKKAWTAAIGINGEKLHIGTFDSPEKAALAYNRAAQKHHGKYAVINTGIEGA